MDDGFGAGFLIGVMAAFLSVFSTEPPITPLSVNYAEEVCKDNQGWKVIEEGYGPMSSLTCKNGATFEYSYTLLKDKHAKKD